MKRREFVTLVGVGSAIAYLPEVVTAEPEATKQKRNDGFVEVGTVKELDKKGELLNKKSPLGPVLLIKDPKNNAIRAVNPSCPHKGCTVKWEKAQDSFVCPCHEAAFSTTGVVSKGPAKENLKTYQTKVEGNVILIKA